MQSQNLQLKGIEHVLDLNQKARNASKYHGNIRIGYFGCMGGRADFVTYVNAPFGMVRQWRNGGGIFDLAQWDSLQASVKEFWSEAMMQGQQVLFIVASHGSDFPILGCKGHKHNSAAAAKCARDLKDALEGFFAGNPDVYVVRIHLETDEEAVTFYGDRNDPLRLRAMPPGISKNEMGRSLGELYQDTRGRMMPVEMFEEVLALAMNNLAHIAEVRLVRRPTPALDHREWILALGGGFDWLHGQSNTAMVVWPHDPDFHCWVVEAVRIISQSVDRPWFSQERGVVIAVSAPYNPDPYGVFQRLAEAKARKLEAAVRSTALYAAPQIVPYLQVLTVTTNMATWELDLISRHERGE